MLENRIQELKKIVADLNGDRSRLLDILWAAQEKNGFVSSEEISVLAEALNCSPADIAEVQSFYHFFRSRASGEHQIYLDNSIISEFSGMPLVRAAFERELGIRVGQVSSDQTFGLFETACIGMSDQGPAALIDRIPFPGLTAAEVPRILADLRAGKKAHAIARLVESHFCKMGPYFLPDPPFGEALTKAMAMAPAQILETIKVSGLRGRGGAGFPTGVKWESCARFQAAQRFVVCNADEGEPGTFKDRILLTHFCDEVFEGMAIAAKAIGAKEAILYLRAEYFYLLETIQASLQRVVEHAHWGDLRLRIQLGAGAYVCGEETALLQSLEGKRGEPRLRPPFPVEKGYLGFPTVVNNVETFVLASRILSLGAEKFAKVGTAKSTGPRLLSISGDVAKPGIYEVPWGVTLQEVLDLAGARDPAIIQVGGPSGECLSMKSASRKISFEDLPTGGSLMVFSKQRDLFRILDNFLEFFVNESCGVCTPCRAGNIKLRDILKKIRQGHGRREDFASIQDWAQIISKSSRCGLGATSPRVLTSAIAAFPEIFDHALRSLAEPLIYDFDETKATLEYDEFVRSPK